jgi:tRNA threonylcarbamoyl adenosine modification protein YeaZ
LPPDRLILGFDTSAAHCAAALLSGGRVLAAVEEPMATGQAERLLPLLAGVLAAGGAAWRDLWLIAVGTGPGNFTGVRIGVAAARGLALGLGIPAVGVTRFQALALGHAGPLTVVEDARRGEVYAVRLPGGVPAVMAAGQAAALGGPFLGSAAGQMPGPELAARVPLAEAVARVAAALPPGQPRPAPFYLRAADAAPPSDPPPVILP